MKAIKYILILCIGTMSLLNVSCSNENEQKELITNKEDQSNKPPSQIVEGTGTQANGYYPCSGSCNAGCETGWTIYTDGQGHFYKHYWSVSSPAPYSLSATTWITTNGGVITWHQTTWVTSC